MRNAKLRQIYLNLPRINKSHIVLRNKIIDACHVSKQTFYNWTQCVTEVPEHHKQTIAQILNMPVDEIFTSNFSNTNI